MTKILCTDVKMDWLERADRCETRSLTELQDTYKMKYLTDYFKKLSIWEF